MKKQIKNIFILSFLVIAVFVGFTSCSDWTEIDKVEMTEPDIETDQPELWAKYLQALKVYKQTDHKYMYGVFDNSSKDITSRGQSILSLPDSLDFVVMMYPDNLSELELKDMTKVREKSTKVIYEISYFTLEADWKAYQESIVEPEPEVTADGEEGEGEGEPTPEPETFETFTKTWVANQIAICDKYNYDGIVIFYKGKEIVHSTPAEIAEYTATQQTFLNPIIEWKGANEVKTLVFQGYPHNVMDKTFLEDCKHLIIPTEYKTSIGALDFELRRVVASGVPLDRFIVRVFETSLDAADLDTGFFTTGRAVTETAYWMGISDSNFTKAGMSVINISNGYYNPAKTYKYTREAFGIMN